MKRLVSLAVAALAFTACQDASGPASELHPTAPTAVNAAKGVPIPGDYIVTLRDNVTDVAAVAQSISGLHKGALKHVYKSALKGFAVQNISEAAAAAIASDPRVERIEADQVMTASAVGSWGQDRVDERARKLDGSFTASTDGTGVTAYIIDTGIGYDNVDFLSLDGTRRRANPGEDEVTAGGGAVDCNGHGTHVSGTVGGLKYGLAANVDLVGVRVLNCSGSGSTSGVIAGINWVTAQQACTPNPAPNCGRPGVANMSLGGGFSTSLNQAVANAVTAGVTFAVAAGNSSADACLSSPSSEKSAITVGATDINDVFASFSNRGSCVDINAPGVAIVSDWIGSTTATNTISGTSMASPHVAGAAALYLSQSGLTDKSPAAVTAALTGNATRDVLKSVPSGTINALLYVGNEPVPPPPPQPPTASFSHSCSGLTCTFTNTSTNTSSNSNDPTTYAWNFGDGSSVVTTTSPSHTFPPLGRRTYTVRLTALDSRGSTTASQSVNCNKRSCS